VSDPAGNELLAFIQEAVRAQDVPAGYHGLVTELVAQTVIRVMSDPRFLMRLSVVLELQEQNQQLRNALAAVQVGKVRTKKAAARKAPPRKAPAVRVRPKGGTPAQRRAFQEGYGDR
jgi:hypothetical protein